jgi:hypothetical protein
MRVGRLIMTVVFHNIRAGNRRHPETLPYRCYLSVLAGFGRLRRAGPARTGASILEEKWAVKSFDEQTGFFFGLCDAFGKDLQSLVDFRFGNAQRWRHPDNGLGATEHQ